MAPRQMMISSGAAQITSSRWVEWSQSGSYRASLFDSRYFQAKKTVSAITGMMMISISTTDQTSRSRCCAAMSPAGDRTTASQPDIRAIRGSSKRGRRRRTAVPVREEGSGTIIVRRPYRRPPKGDIGQSVLSPAQRIGSK
ncbi:hypothetical protein D3C72_1308320 [compost metagenome]